MIRYFRKKPIPVPMVEWTGKNLNEIQEFTGYFEVRTPLDGDTPAVPIPIFQVTSSIGDAQIYSSEERGWVPCQRGHFIVKGIRGEFYPISPAALEESYDEVTDEVTL